MNDLEGISFFQLGRGMRFPGNDITIELNHDATWADLQFFKQPSHIEPVRDLPLFSVDTNFHINKKPSPQTTPWWLGKTVSSSSRLTLPNARGTVTLALPYAGAIRIRFEGLPGYSFRLSVRLRQTPLAFRDS